MSGWVLRQVGFVQDENALAVSELREVTLVGVSEWFGRVQHMQNKVGLFEAFVAATDAFFLDFVGGIAEAGGINEDHGQAPNVGGFLDGIACGARDGRDDGSIVAEELVEKAGFAGVRPADDRGADASAKDLAFICCAKQFVNESDAAFEA